MIRAEKKPSAKSAPRKARKPKGGEVVQLPVVQRARIEEPAPVDPLLQPVDEEEIVFTRDAPTAPADVQEARRKLEALRKAPAEPAPPEEPAKPQAEEQKAAAAPEAPAPYRPRQPKAHVSLRLDADVLEAFKATGKGWQTLVNDVLRAALPLTRD
jgi:uncharacterized protein (DUF4415 family)